MLRRQDLKAVLSFVADAHDADGPEALDRELLDRLADLFGCEYATYDAIDWRRRLVTAYIPCSNEDPQAVPPPYYPEEFWTSPDWMAKKRAAFYKLSDNIPDRRERERQRAASEFNAEFRVVDHVSFRVGGTRTRCARLMFDSQHRDFGERDRELALALRPHVEALWRRSIARRQVAELAAALEDDGDTEARQAIVLFDADGRIDHATPEARALLAGWFGAKNGRLPDELREWQTIGGTRYTERRNGSVLTVEAAGDFTLILRERASHDIHLTPREREVLGRVAEGLTNVEIARTLWVAPSTVAKHLEQAYSKLGVHSRTAAIARFAKLSD